MTIYAERVLQQAYAWTRSSPGRRQPARGRALRRQLGPASRAYYASLEYRLAAAERSRDLQDKRARAAEEFAARLRRIASGAA
jgi:hypothetical protein